MVTLVDVDMAYGESGVPLIRQLNLFPLAKR